MYFQSLWHLVLCFSHVRWLFFLCLYVGERLRLVLQLSSLLVLCSEALNQMSCFALRLHTYLVFSNLILLPFVRFNCLYFTFLFCWTTFGLSLFCTWVMSAMLVIAKLIFTSCNIAFSWDVSSFGDSSNKFVWSICSSVSKKILNTSYICRYFCIILMFWLNIVLSYVNNNVSEWDTFPC